MKKDNEISKNNLRIKDIRKKTPNKDVGRNEKAK